MDYTRELLWKLFVELRKELLVAQETRAKVIGFKITFLSAGIALIYANADIVSSELIIIPAIAAVFFDLLINSYSISIKRIGFYSRHYLEPGLLTGSDVPVEFRPWESFVGQKELKQRLSMFGNLGITFILMAAAGIEVFTSLKDWRATSLVAVLLVLFAVDLYAHLLPRVKIDRLVKPDLDFESIYNRSRAQGRTDNISS